MYPAVHARSHPDKAAIIMGCGQTVTYRQLNERSNQCARLFASLDLDSDAVVALFLVNCPDYFYAAWGAQRSGLYYTPISTHLAAAEAAYIVRNSDSKVVVLSYALREVACKLRQESPGVHTWLMVGGTIEGFESFEELLDRLPVTPIAREFEGSVMLYSSGTTGYPKGIKHANPLREIGNPGPLVMGILASFGIGQDTVYLSPAPLYHAAPIRFCMAMHRIGATAVVMEHFDAQQALRLIAEHRVTFSQWVPTMFIRMLKLPQSVRESYDVSSQQVATHSAAPCPVAVKQQMIDWWGPILVEYYGATEGHGGTQIDSHAWLAHRGSVGKPVYGSVHILNEQGLQVPAGGIGSVYFAGGATFEYHHSEKQTLQSRVGNMSTVGDVGYVDADGFLYLTDRKANMIICGGVNVYPQEIENLLVMHPAVADVAVIGVPNEDLGEEVKAVVEPIDFARCGPQLEQELITWCRAQLSHIKCPRSVDFERKLPRSDAGKLFKRTIRERYWQGRESSII